MQLSIETIIEATKGMTPKQFETYAKSHGISITWDDVCIWVSIAMYKGNIAYDRSAIN